MAEFRNTVAWFQKCPKRSDAPHSQISDDSWNAHFGVCCSLNRYLLGAVFPGHTVHFLGLKIHRPTLTTACASYELTPMLQMDWTNWRQQKHRGGRLSRPERELVTYWLRRRLQVLSLRQSSVVASHSTALPANTHTRRSPPAATHTRAPKIRHLRTIAQHRRN